MKLETLKYNNYPFQGKECAAQFLKAFVLIFTDENKNLLRKTVRELKFCSVSFQYREGPRETCTYQ